MPVSNLKPRASARTTPIPARVDNITTKLHAVLVGQPQAISTIVPYVEMFQAGLNPEGRPAGIFMLLGPTGTGKTRTVQALAQALHDNSANVLRIDCGEFQHSHEVAKLIGSPPGYLGHRETPALLNQTSINNVASPGSGLSLLLFDEIEKAAHGVSRFLLSILDRGTATLGDNSTVNFEKTLIFMTSNLGAQELGAGAKAGWGPLAPGVSDTAEKTEQQHRRITDAAIRKHFPPEFLNRIDETITYRALAREDFRQILDIHIQEANLLLLRRIGPRAPKVQCTEAARTRILDEGVSAEYGGRHLKRALHRRLMQPLARKIMQWEIVGPRATVVLDHNGDEFLFLVRQ
jgi:ATP-dependent Clp protease ATP-binding subunit ClpA